MSENKVSSKALINGIIVAVDVLAKIVGIVTSLIGNEIIGGIILIIAVFAAVIMVYIVISNFFKASRGIKVFKKKYIDNCIIVGHDFHCVFHEIRNSSAKILNQTATDVASLDDYFKKEEQNICTKIEQMFFHLWHKDTCVCIKLLSADDIYSNDYTKWKVYTYARGNAADSINQRGRTKNDQVPVLITDNSDFEIIVNGTVNYFVCENMETVVEAFVKDYGMVYKNSRQKNGESISNITKYYNATIVLPIRIEIDKIRLKQGNCQGYHLLGFLCIDTLEAFSNEEQSGFRLGAEYAKSIADSLYNQLFNYFIKRISIRNKSNTDSQTNQSSKENTYV